MVSPRAVAAMSSLALGGCFVAVPLEDLECPCGPGWVCVEETARCEPVVPESCRPGIEPSSIAIVGLRVSWRTPAQARLHWETAETIPDATGISHYELLVADDANQLRREQGVTVYDGDTNPELARDYLPFTGASNRVENTTVPDLEPERSYAARLLLYDTSGGLSCSDIVPIAAGVTPGGTDIVIFEDTAPVESYTGCFEVSDDPPQSYEGTSHLHRVQQCQLLPDEMGIDHETSLCDPAEPMTRVIYTQCWVNMTLGGLAIPLDVLSVGEARSAFLELYIRVTDSRPAYWVEVRLLRDDGGAEPASFFVTAPSIRPDDLWQKIQIPLTELRLAGADGTAGEPFSSAAFPTGLNGFRFGAVFDVGATIRIDSVRIRW